MSDEKKIHPLIKDIKFFNDLDSCGNNVADMTERVYQATYRKDDVYDQRSFIKKMQLDPFRVDGFYVGDLFKPDITMAYIEGNDKFNITASVMPEKYKHVQSVWQVSTSNTFTVLVKDIITSDQAELNSIITNMGVLPYETDYYIRVKYKTPSSETTWSNIYKLRTADIKEIVKPTITAVINNLNSITMNSSHYDNNGQIELPHLKSVWQISSSASFTSTIYNLDSLTNLEFVEASLSQNISTGIDYYCRVKYCNNLSESEWSTPCTISVPDIAAPEILTVILKDDNTFEITISEFEHDLLSHTNTSWELSKNEEFLEPVIRKFSDAELLIGTLDTSSDITMDDDTTYYFRAKFHSDLVMSEWSPFKAIKISNIDKPVIVSSNFTENKTINLVASVYEHDIFIHNKTTWLISDNMEFNILLDEVIVTEGELTQLAYTPSYPLELDKEYYFKVRYHSSDVESSLSDTYTFKILPIVTPTINTVEFTTEFNFNVDSSLFFHEVLTHTSSVWQISNGIEFNELTFDIEDDINLTSRIIDPGFILPEKTKYYCRVKYISDNFSSEFSSPFEIETPEVKLPIIDNYILEIEDRTINISCLPFEYLDLVPDKTEWEISLIEDFSVVLDTYLETDELKLNQANFILDKWQSTTYYIRCRQYSDMFISDWSLVYPLQIESIVKPIISSGSINDTSFTFDISSSVFNQIKFSHVSSTWEVNDDIDFNGDNIYENTSTISLISNNIKLPSYLIPGKDYFIRVKYNSTDISSDYSEAYKITTNNLSKPSIINSSLNLETKELTLTSIEHSLYDSQLTQTIWEMSLVSDFSAIESNKNNTEEPFTTCKFIISDIDTNKNYYFRVKYQVNDAISVFSDNYIFNIPIIEKPIISNVGLTNTTFNFNVTSSSYTHTILPHINSIWEVSYVSNFLSKILEKTSTTELVTSELDLEVDLKPITDYYIRVKYNSIDNESSEYSDGYKFTTLALPKPVINSYVLNSELKKFTLGSTAFNFYNKELTKAIWEISTDNTFATVLETKTIETPSDMLSTSFTLVELLADTNYYFRVKHYSGEELVTEWSDTITLKTAPVGAIETPTIITTGTMCVNNFLLEASAFSKIGDITQTKTIWQICENNTFAVDDPTLQEFIIDESSTDPFNTVLITQANLVEGKQYYIRVRYLSEPTP